MEVNGIRKRSTRISIAMLSAILLAFCQTGWAAEKPKQTKVYRWVDENGEVHYSETLPADTNIKTHDELDQTGMVRAEGVSNQPPPPPPKPEPKVDAAKKKTELPRDKSGLKRPDPLYSDAEKKKRMDQMLLLRYHSEAELTEAMDVEIKQLQYDARLLNTTRESLESTLKRNIIVAGDRQRAGLEVKPDTLKSIAKIRSQLQTNSKSLENLKVREQQIRDDFGRNIERYRELSAQASEENS